MCCAFLFIFFKTGVISQDTYFSDICQVHSWNILYLVFKKKKKKIACSTLNSENATSQHFRFCVFLLALYQVYLTHSLTILDKLVAYWKALLSQRKSAINIGLKKTLLYSAQWQRTFDLSARIRSGPANRAIDCSVKLWRKWKKWINQEWFTNTQIRARYFLGPIRSSQVRWSTVCLYS